MTVSGRAAPRRPPVGRPLVRVAAADIDRWPHLIHLVAAGVLGAAGLALFGLPPVDIHGPLHYVRVMDPLCGMTRATRHLARGEMAEALTYNPAVVFPPAVTALVAVRWVWGRLTGVWLDVSVRRSVPLLVLAGVAVAVLWARQQAHVDLLTRR